MRVKYVRTHDLEVMEGTVNLLLSQGWEFYRELQVLPEGDYFVAMLNHDRPPRGSARAVDMPRTSGRGRTIEPYLNYSEREVGGVGYGSEPASEEREPTPTRR